jgi:hypothetical protein
MPTLVPSESPPADPDSGVDVLLFKGMGLVVLEGACNAVLGVELLEAELELAAFENELSMATITIAADVLQQAVLSFPQQ